MGVGVDPTSTGCAFEVSRKQDVCLVMYFVSACSSFHRITSAYVLISRDHIIFNYRRCVITRVCIDNNL